MNKTEVEIEAIKILWEAGFTYEKIRTATGKSIKLIKIALGHKEE